MFRRYVCIGALCACSISIVSAQGQDSPGLARALERAERFDTALGARPQPAGCSPGYRDQLRAAATSARASADTLRDRSGDRRVTSGMLYRFGWG